jgi:hypothetical protein
VISPVGNLSHYDGAGGNIKDPTLRDVCARTLFTEFDPKTPIFLI